jgi:hypothetical protein
MADTPHDIPASPFPAPPPASVVTRRETPRAARAGVTAGVGGMVAALLAWRGHTGAAVVVGAIAASLALVEATWPAGSARVRRVMAAFARIVGEVTTTLVLAPVHLIVLPLLRLGFWAAREDPLRRRLGATSYWEPVPAARTDRRFYGHLFYREADVPLRPTFARRWVLRLAALSALLICAEITLRMFFGLGEPILYANHPAYGYGLVPDQRTARRGGARIEVNRYGMRSRATTSAPAPDTYRVLMLGDSVTYGGSYIDQDDLFAARLERALSGAPARIPAGRASAEVLVAAVNGWGAHHQLGYVDWHGFFGAHHVVVVLPRADLVRPLYDLTSKPYFGTERPPRLALEEVLLKQAWRLFRLLQGDVDAPQRDLLITRAIDAYAELSRRARLAGARIDFVWSPVRWDVEAGAITGTPWADAYRRFVARHAQDGVAVHTPLEALVEHGDDPALYHDETHFGPKGHEVVGRWLADTLFPAAPHEHAEAPR